MFEGITSGVHEALSFINRGRLTESNIRDGLRQVRQALLEADVNYDVAKEFIDRVSEQALGEQVLKSLRPSEQIVHIVYQELVRLLGGDPSEQEYTPSSPAQLLGLKREGVTVLMMCGLQGSGKTTTCGKLARMLDKQGIRPMLVAADLQRPAAIEQLELLGSQLGVPVHAEDPASSSPVAVCQHGIKAAKKSGDVRVVILDTAGRLTIDDELMRELRQIDNRCGPDQAVLVADAMTGQDAVNSAAGFNEALELDSIILTKTDGDTRGGAALSIKAVTGVPLRFVGTGETLDGLEAFHPNRMAGRILGGGDMATLLEKAQTEFDEAEVEEAQRKMAEGRFTLDDFRKQMRMIGRLGPIRNVAKMIPGLGQMAEMGEDVDMDKEVDRIGSMIDSMTAEERTYPERIDRSRRNRIAAGSGTDPADINRLLKDFNQIGGMMQNMSQMGMRDRMKAVQDMAGQAMSNPGGGLRSQKNRSKRGAQNQAAARQKQKKKRKDAKKQKKKNR